ncbi:MAG TPA: extracellular solute-binding protein [Xanthobacteraceae bacterium]|nr:extracellular solute-binding protein [Xanthobacteraceae bacterium]
MKRGIAALLAAGGFAFVLANTARAEDLTIFWAEWDPANYLQELVNDYTKETGVKVTVETTPWSDFQTKTFREFAAKGSAYDMVVGDSQWLGAGSTQGHYVDLTDFFKKHDLEKLFLPATVVGYAEYPIGSHKYWAIPLEGDANGWAYRKDWFEDPKEKTAFKAKYGYELGVPKDYKQLRDIAEFFYRPDQKRYGIAIYTDNSYDAIAMGVEQTIFSYGGELGNYATYKVNGIVNSKPAIAGLEAYRELYKFTPPGWGKAFFLEDNQAITEGLAAMSMNFFAFFPALANPTTNSHASGTGFFANPAGPTGAHFAALGGQGISIVSYSKKREAAMKFLEWFVKDSTQKKWGELGGYTCSKAILESDAFRKATPYNEAFYQSMLMVKDFWATPEYAELLDQLNQRLYPYIVDGKGTATDALNGVDADWTATFKKYKRYTN